MKHKCLLLILTLFLFSSCILKSLQPFYTKASLSYNAKLLGQWEDNKKGLWTIESITSKMDEDRKPTEIRSKEDLIFYEAYKEGYFINFNKDNNEASFIAMPFKIKNQYFMDFIPLEIDDKDINDLAAEHLLKTHSVAKLDINRDDLLSFSWLSEERLRDVLKANKLRIKHEKIGPNETLLLTASSTELYAFLKKYLEANLFDVYEKNKAKWKSSDKLTLTKADAKP